MTNSNLLPFSFPAVGRKAVTAAFDGGRLTSDGGVMLLSMAERRLGIAQRLAHWFPDRRDPLRITHTLADMVRARILAIACGYEDADDLDALRVDPAFKLACGRPGAWIECGARSCGSGMAVLDRSLVRQAPNCSRNAEAQPEEPPLSFAPAPRLPHGWGWGGWIHLPFASGCGRS